MNTDEIIKAYLARESTSSILRRFKIGHVKLSEILAAAGVPLRKDCATPLSQEQHIEIVEQYKRGVPVSELLSRFRVGEVRALKILRDAGCQIRPKGEAQGFLPAEVEKAICDAYDRGTRVSEICAEHSLSRIRVTSLLRRRGLYQRAVYQCAAVAPGDGVTLQCSSCGVHKAASAFSRTGRAGSKRDRSYFCLDCARASMRRTKYGIDHAAYAEMLQAQHGKCAICSATTAMRGRAWQLYVDHDHETGVVRKLLCHNCNAMLGHARDNPALLEAGRDYLRAHGKR